MAITSYSESQAACQAQCRDTKSRMNPLHLAVLTQNENVIEELLDTKCKEKLKVQRDSRTRRPIQLLDLDASQKCQNLLTQKSVKISRAQLGTMTSRVQELDALRRSVKGELSPLQKAIQRTTSQFLPKTGVQKVDPDSQFTVKSVSYQR